ncbi:dihydroxyacetone kinase subunit DhaL [Nocardia africana]|uniref:PTS-dependent dihydroxyacetone kinase, ADP-binding subunit dhaL n=1 Tax=Nocardia africana TaxID=134964 RepID=A0A378WZ93_9NOCA|nr:dihydroxyacetone kinase subunit DhaL [Nocardia africana]MCC3313020.1 dihydroxyacetone kinase subunit L [Nocardia africana]SUA45633.1 PTS-dependent dihydroxyacetone kinase, ADP-binding subunit dhaL [Nocardia africana]
MTSEAMKTLDSLVARLQEVFVAAEPALTTLDEITGDGDFGVNLREGFAEVADRLAAPDSPAPWDTVRAVFLDEVGGTSGPLFGLLFQSLGTRAAQSDSYLDALRVGIGDGLAAIQRVGEAEVGDRTMVDALAPAAEALSGDDVAAMVNGAVDGALSTATLRARRGRASYLGERAVGHPDPGAVGVALLLCVLAEPVCGTGVSNRERERLLESVSRAAPDNN